jgi:NADH dehydrogenase [ubiquinone] 1 alpha subcomplex assembly factor 6
VQWWRDAVNDCFKGKPPAQPVTTALAEVLRVAPLTRYRLQQVVTTREEDLLSHAQPASLAALERYAEGTTGQLLLLQLEAAGVSSSSAGSGDAAGGTGSSISSDNGAATAAEHATAHLGKAAGLVGVLRGTYTAGAQRRVYLPADLCGRHGVSEEDVLMGRDSDGLRDVTQEVAAAAQQHLEAARRLAADVAPGVRPLFAPAVAAAMYLRALEAAQFNLFDQRMLRVAVSPLELQLRLKWALLRNKY